jgi:GNAT superfamily N-acetyltransferase
MRDMNAGEPGSGALPQPGSRVVVRHRLPAPDPGTGARLTDVVGDLVEVSEQALVVRTRAGEVRVPTEAVEVVREVPPRPTRRGAPHRALSVDDLQRVMVGAWPAMETARLGDWVLRAARGFTQRANSVMTAGDPGVPLAEAVGRVEQWYADRGLAPNLTVAGPVGVPVAADPLGALLLDLGYVGRVPTRTLTAPVTGVLGSTRAEPAASGAGVVVTTEPDLSEDWLAAYRRYREVDEQAARAVLTGSPAQDLATARTPDGHVVGVARLGVASAWGGLAAMWVDPGLRHRGVATALLRALAERAREHGVHSLHLQTDTDNAPAVRLYERHGFEPHHDYVNLRRP